MRGCTPSTTRLGAVARDDKIDIEFGGYNVG